MMKKFFISVILLFGFLTVSLADEQRLIKLNDFGHQSETVESTYCNIILSLERVGEDEDYIISVEVEDTDDNKILLLFDKPYAEKDLKRMSIIYDKSFGGSKGIYDKVFGGINGMRPPIDACPDLNGPKRICPSEKYTLYRIAGSTVSPVSCRLPIYISKYKNKSGKKILLLEEYVIELDINVRLKPDEEYIRLTDAYHALIGAIDTTYFCTNKYHKGESVDELKSRFQSKIGNLKTQIDSIIDTRGYYPSDKGFKKYKELSDSISAITFDERIVDHCPKDKKDEPAMHKCKYCRLSYEAIYRKLENYYIDIYNGSKTKAQVLGEVEALYACVSRNKTRPRNNSYKSRITTYYNKIKSL